jgi:hypothetical protein
MEDKFERVMQPLVRVKATLDPDSIARMRREAESAGLDFDAEVAPRLFARRCEVFENADYRVSRERVGPLWHLAIRSDHRNWRAFQQIKNELVGPTHEGVELFPAESRRVNLGSEHHLWVSADESFRFPFGFRVGDTE